MHAISAVALAVFLLAVGVAHFVVPAYFRSLVPSWIGPAGPVVAVSGAAEIAVGTLVLAPGGRTAGGWAAAGLVTVYLVSHLDALWHARAGHSGLLRRPIGAASRLVVNIGYIGWAVAVALAPA
ncbi:DoxX family protein [Streptomyces griseocarneus]|uniref:DoxX family protein n=1 Tax=Streptomyces griseocarneus TaxID=51201 RepID=UPI00167D839D|nr:hypothetical protein [Streptomyces griseocarneus]MBZ6477990.1 hypothetical protein [Streptomyces griseocarneus]GHG54692.1 hypothetical protein GCM10018779_17840 [Streptomyces griseocarneus]